MFTKEDLNELELSLSNAESKDVIKALLLFVGTLIIFYSLFY
jgi:hypothetical protein